MMQTQTSLNAPSAPKTSLQNKLRVIEHPVLSHKLGMLRNRATTPHEFRQLFEELAGVLAYEVSRDLPLKDEEVETPLEKTKVRKIAESVIVACILRAGEGMLSGFLKALPSAQVGHIGIYRDKLMHNTVEYYFKLPADPRGKTVYLLDPLLATGDTALAALDRLKEYEVGRIKLITLFSAEVGLKKVHEAHPDVEIYTLSVERALNDRGYLLPGVGDAGDRLFGTL
jgi:uracil phosphoribosyltransferase